MFNDPAWVAGPSDHQREGLNEWLADAGRIVVVEIGAGTDIPTVRHFSERLVAVGARAWCASIRGNRMYQPVIMSGLPTERSRRWLRLDAAL